MNVRRITKQDFDRIVEVIDQWWGGPLGTFAHPIFFYELGGQALVVEKDGLMIGFLLGFVVRAADSASGGSAGASTLPADASPAGGAPADTGYVHLVGIHPDHRRKGVGRLLYERFTEACRAVGCRKMKAITAFGNEGSIRFHAALGWETREIDDYAGPNRRRIVFTRSI